MTATPAETAPTSDVAALLTDDRQSGATAGGTYFVSNYPPYPTWRPEAVLPVPTVLDQPAPADAPLGVYVHVPFCRKRCHFCYFKVYTGQSSSEVRAYVDAVAQEVRLLADRAAFEGRRSHFLYVGGGTPSYLSVRQVSALKDALAPLVAFDALEELTFECEPGTLTRAKLDALRDLGVTRLSLGVESFAQETLEANGRAHGRKHVYKAYEDARAAGLPQINIDLIAGMIGDTEAGWQASVADTLALEPDSVTIYQMEVPFNTTLFRRMREGGDGAELPVADWPTKRRWVAEAFEAFEDAGYTWTSGYTAVRDPSKATFVYRDSLWHGADMVGLGVSAFSHIGGTHYQNAKHLADYQDRVAAGELPIQRGHVMTADERFVRQLVLQLKTGRVSRRWFRQTHGVDPLDPARRWAAPFRALAEQGLAHVPAFDSETGGDDADAIRLTREALVQVDRLLPAFFLPEHRPTPRPTTRPSPRSGQA